MEYWIQGGDDHGHAGVGARDLGEAQRGYKKQADDFMKQLYMKQQAKEKKTKTNIQFDVMKGQIWIADNFDDPLPCFEEYM